MGEGHEAVLAVVAAHAAVPCGTGRLRPRAKTRALPPGVAGSGAPPSVRTGNNTGSAQDEWSPCDGTRGCAPLARGLSQGLREAGRWRPSGPSRVSRLVWLMDVQAEARGPHRKGVGSLGPRTAPAPPEPPAQGWKGCCGEQVGSELPQTHPHPRRAESARTGGR